MTKVAVVMGSISDWPTMKLTVDVLTTFDVIVERHIISAHRMPQQLMSFAKEARMNDVDVIIAGAGGAAHLPGMLAANTIIPVIGVPIQSHALNGLDSLLSIVQMPAGVPVGTVAIGNAGAKNAAYYALQMLSLKDARLIEPLEAFRTQQMQTAIDSEALFDE
ncbi:5-(carboxyamino)imidazole ribonucleotide mutase [Weissella diestrammenae]|uniref:N5-carboxyaminoimidazole ribonucleotide mutase n=1 Tax=Weissella diestrammenae TaxID=1162633 RepID=A0A7G9T449_9LACO|nr:5-(carboxyamino)imidazole ribonucleotide mutase [Weissella diestrammenae]MCM0583395.1 5-(carboxyamino)imidazole ribonucleotide mutase [Weissella diestrammenae]QNN74874.1 5-(carboxyamino)imidazole ribonucleotide mutase [Weissella diestrammenae]